MKQDEVTTSHEILIVDDSPAEATLMREAIKETMVRGNVHIIDDAADAIKLLNKQPPYENTPRPDLIILDLKMPAFNGHEFLRVVKQDPRFSDIPVIMHSTSNLQEDIAESYRLGANCYVVKPVNPMKFRKVIRVINDFWLGVAELPPKRDENSEQE